MHYLPPSNHEAERATLGSCLLNREAIIAIADTLSAADFYDEMHAWVYEAILACYAKRTPPDFRTVADELRRRERLDAVGGVPFLSGLIDDVPTSYHVVAYAKEVRETALRRNMIAASGKLAALAYDARDASAEELHGQAIALISGVFAPYARGGLRHVGDIWNDLWERLREAAEHDRPPGLLSGFRAYDDLIGGWQPGELILLAARPGVGKSSLALGVAWNVARTVSAAGGSVAFFSLEMGDDQLGARLLAMETQIDQQKIRQGRIREAEVERIAAAIGGGESTALFVDDTGALTLPDLRAKCLRQQATHGLDLIVVDYLQLMQGTARKDGNRVQEVSELSRGLKNLARELRIPILALSQLSRAVEQRADKVPQLSDLRESGSLEQDADSVLFIYREELYDEETDKKGIAELHIAKNRNGPLGVIPLHFNPATTRFHDLSFRTPEGY